MYNWSIKDFNEKGYDAGKKEKHIRLVNPDKKEIIDAFIVAGQYLKSFVGKKNWNGGQITFIYAGHGLMGNGALYISEDSFSAENLLNNIVVNLPLSNERCRIDLILDSCYSGAFVGHFIEEAQKHEDKIFPFELFGSCLHNETSLESSEWEHGILTFSFQKSLEIDPFQEPKDEFLPDWQEEVKCSLFQGGVTYLSSGRQHAFNLRNGNLKVYGATRFFNIFDELDKDEVLKEDLFKMMDRQREKVQLIDFEKPYSKEMFLVLF